MIKHSLSIITVLTVIILLQQCYNPRMINEDIDMQSDACDTLAEANITIVTQPSDGFSNHSFELVWESVEYAKDYTVLLINDPNGTASIRESKTTSDLSWTTTILIPGEYAMRVQVNHDSCQTLPEVQSNSFMVENEICETFYGKELHILTQPEDGYSNNPFTIQWEGIAQTEYSVELIKNPDTSQSVILEETITDTTWNPTVTEDGTYGIKITAIRTDCGESLTVISDSFTVTTVNCPAFLSSSYSILTQPTSGLTGDSFSVDWNPNPESETYTVQLISDPFGSKTIQAMESTTNTTWAQTINTVGTYMFKILAKKAGCLGSVNIQSSSFTVEDAVCAGFLGGSLTITSEPIDGPAGNSFSVEWSDVTNAEDYKVELISDPSGSNTVVSSSVESTTSFNTVINNPGEYIFYITAQNSTCIGGPSPSNTSVEFSVIDYCTYFGSLAVNITSQPVGAVAGSTFSVEWDSVTDAEDYTIELIKDPLTTPSVVSSNTQAALTYGEIISTEAQYQFRITANHGSCVTGPIQNSSVFEVSSAPCPTYYASSLTITTQPNNDLRLETYSCTWDAVVGATSYTVDLYQDPAGTNTLIQTYPIPSGTSWSDSIADSGDYNLVITADNTSCTTGTDPEVTSNTFTVTDDPPTFSGATSIDWTANRSDSQVTLTWTAGSDDVTATGDLVYNVYVETTPNNQNYSTPYDTSTAGATQINVTDLDPDTLYYIVIRTEDNYGQLDSSPIVELSITTATLAGSMWTRTSLPLSRTIDAPCFGEYTADVDQGELTLTGDGYGSTGTAFQRAFTNNDPYGGGLDTYSQMDDGEWEADHITGVVQINGIDGRVRNKNCDGGLLCNFACNAFLDDSDCSTAPTVPGSGGACYDIGSDGGSGKDQVDNFDTKNAGGSLDFVDYDITVSGGMDYLTIHRLDYVEYYERSH
jgi:hypothetical protein